MTERRTGDRTEKKVDWFMIGFTRERWEYRFPWPSLGFGDDGRCMSGGRDEGLTIFITSMSSSKSLTSFTNRIFHLGDHQAWGWRLMQPKEMENLAAFIAKKESSSREKRAYSSAEGQWESKVKSKSGRNELSKNCRKGAGSLKQKSGEMGTVRRIGKWSQPKSWSTSQEQEGKEREQRRCQERINCQRSNGEELGSLRGRSKEMAQMNAFSPW